MECDRAIRRDRTAICAPPAVAACRARDSAVRDHGGRAQTAGMDRTQNAAGRRQPIVTITLLLFRSGAHYVRHRLSVSRSPVATINAVVHACTRVRASSWRNRSNTWGTTRHTRCSAVRHVEAARLLCHRSDPRFRPARRPGYLWTDQSFELIGPPPSGVIGGFVWRKSDSFSTRDGVVLCTSPALISSDLRSSPT
jgi:hypothetical protein